jgi:hypothetical protein
MITKYDPELIDTQPICQTHLTFDIDWAPDKSIDEIRKIINPLGIKATFFVTHNCEVLDQPLRFQRV